MLSFYELSQKIQKIENTNNDGNAIPEDESAINAVRSGMNISSTFWDDFIKLTGNANDVAVLLDIPREKIAGWGAKIKAIQDKIARVDGENADDKAAMLSTGDYPEADMRPTP